MVKGGVSGFLVVSGARASTSYEVLVDSKKFTSCKVSLAVAIHLAGLTPVVGSNPNSSRRRSARYFTYWLM